MRNLVAKHLGRLPESLRGFLSIFLPVACAICAGWWAWWIYAESAYSGMDARGQLGDLFGGVNALFSGMALAGVVTAVILQCRELQLQREEMERNREELKLTREEMALQREQLTLQRQELELSRQEYSRMAAANEDAARALTKQLKMQAIGSTINGLSSMLESANSRCLANVTNRHAVTETDVLRIRDREDHLQRGLEQLQRELEG